MNRRCSQVNGNEDLALRAPQYNQNKLFTREGYSIKAVQIVIEMLISIDKGEYKF